MSLRRWHRLYRIVHVVGRVGKADMMKSQESLALPAPGHAQPALQLQTSQMASVTGFSFLTAGKRSRP